MPKNYNTFKKRILLVQPPLEDFYTTPIRLYPLGLLYVATVLERQGHEVIILDTLNPFKKRTIAIPEYFSYLKKYLNEPLFFKSYHRFGLLDSEILKFTKQIAPDLIGISSNCTAYYKNVSDLAERLKKELLIPIVVGGHHATAFADEIYRRTPSIDFVHQGTVEQHFIKELIERKLLPPNPNTEYNWQTLRPAHHLLRAEHYKINEKPYASLVASRGCPYGCLFCSAHKMFGNQMVYRPQDEIIKEMRWLYQKHNVRLFNFEDDNITHDRAWFLSLLETIYKDQVLRGIEITAMNGICYHTLDEEMIFTMHRAGFKRINLSWVTKNDLLRRTYKRPLREVALEHIVQIAKKYQLFLTVYFILGLPGQTYHEAKTTIDELLSLGVLVGPSVFYIPPNSDIYNQLGLPESILQNWNLYRSSAFAVETEQLNREQLIDLFLYTRRENFKLKMKIY